MWFNVPHAQQADIVVIMLKVSDYTSACIPSGLYIRFSIWSDILSWFDFVLVC